MMRVAEPVVSPELLERIAETIRMSCRSKRGRTDIMRSTVWWGGVVMVVGASMAHAEEPGEKIRLEEVVVEAEQGAAAPFLADVEEAKIYAGKKTTVASLEHAPEVQANNYRQAFAQLPGLLTSEQAVASHANFNYRGVGDPHETESLLVLKDGVPIVSDWFGYSTLYYQPPIEAVERIELIRGGSSLLYGPQPGPVLNYVTEDPPDNTGITGRTQHVFGSDGFYSTYNTLGGTSGPFGYLGYVSRRQIDGARPNADSRVTTGSVKGTWQVSEAGRLSMAMDAYASESGEAGRLSLTQYRANRDFTRTPNDRIWIERLMPSVTYTHAWSEDTTLVATGWAGSQDRLSRRQTGSATNLDLQEFAFLGTDTRLRHAWQAGGHDLVTTGGFVVYASDSPRSRRRGTEPHATTGPTRFELDRQTIYGALFGEQLVEVGRLSVIPAFRLELIGMKVQEQSNVEVTRALLTDSYASAVPLGALGLAYDLTRGSALYANISQGYRPKKYDDLVNPTSSTQVASSNLEESRTWTYEFGVRGTPVPWWVYDASYFFIDYRDYVETLTLAGGNTERANSGHARFQGVELASECDLIGLYDRLAGTAHGDRWGRLGLSQNLSILSAEFVNGSNNGRDPAYAPKYLLKMGAVYRWQDRVKLALTNQFVGAHYWQDSNAAGSVGTAKIASYKAWDLTAEVVMLGDWLRITAGVNNLFDEDYYSRVRSDGIEPAARRTYYLGGSITF
jgi:Fe(3+) dicitrate transport protein